MSYKYNNQKRENKYPDRRDSHPDRRDGHQDRRDGGGFQDRREGGGGGRNRVHRAGRNNDINNERLAQTFTYTDAKELLEKEDIFVSPEVLEREVTEFGDVTIDGLDEDDENNKLKDTLHRGIIAYGFENPSTIQGKAIPLIINGKEFIAQSQSGTGKTGAFVIGALQVINENINKPQVLIISPTTDLAYQICCVGKAIAQYMPNIHFSLSIGGTPRGENIKKIGGVWQGERSNEVAQIVVGTPGRLKDLTSEFPHLFDHVKLLVIDECDELLTGTFKEDIKKIISDLPDVQICLFSATMTNEVVKLADEMLRDPLKILIKKEKITLDGIKQTYMNIPSIEEKKNAIIEMLSTCPIEKFIVYVNSKRNVEDIKEFLEFKGFKVLSITSDMDKLERISIIQQFKSSDIKCLISTDLLARGIDIQQLSLVVNYDLPKLDNIQAYIHRIGRTGRYGRKGLAINFVSSRFDETTINRIQALFRCEIKPIEEDDVKDI